MREIDLNSSTNLSVLPVDTVLVYGETGTGKTTFSAGFPRPLILADGTESGWDSLYGLTDDQLFEPDVNPMVWAIDTMDDMSSSIAKIPAYIASGRIKTVVISSITFYANTYLAHLMRTMKGADPRQIYGALAVHLREIRTRIHALGINVVWEALADRPEIGEEGKETVKGRPSIAGKSADQFSAGVSYLMRATLDEVKDKGAIVDKKLRLYTQTTGNYIARPRIGKGLPQLPNPLFGGYKGFLRARGFDPDRLRLTLPPLPRTTAPVKAPVAVAKPPAPKAVAPSTGAKPASK